jgi:hypothetical protein
VLLSSLSETPLFAPLVIPPLLKLWSPNLDLSIKMNNIECFDTHIKIYIEKSKTDIYRRGNSVVIASTNTAFCPVVWLKTYFELASLQFNSDSYISIRTTSNTTAP